MILGYFTNKYPWVSHSFIRREILALEGRGNQVRRYALRAGSDVLDPADRDEIERTDYILQQSPPRFIASSVRIFFRHPIRVVRALWRALRLSRKSKRGVIRHIAYWAEATVLAQWCERDNVDHLHAHFGTNSALVALLAHEIANVPFSFTVHGPEEFDSPEAIALGEKIRGAAFVAAVSSYGQSQLMRWVEPEHWSKIKIIHCGLDGEFSSHAVAPPSEEPRLVCIARFSPQKGHLILLDALRDLRDQGVMPRLVLIGDGEMRSGIEQRIKELELGPQVTLTGWATGEQIRRELELARALVVPSLAEGLPVVIMEAMAMGRPVIATYIAGIPELIIPRSNGWLVPASDRAALVDALRAVCSASTQEIQLMGDENRRRVADRHNISNEAEKLEYLMRSPPSGVCV